MKKILVTLGCIFILTACATTSTSAEKESRFTNSDRYLVITTDKETGCKYLVYREWSGQGMGAGITPLLKSDGTVDCN